MSLTPKSPSGSTEPPRLQPPPPQQLRRIATEAGLHAIGFTTADPFDTTRDQLEERKAAGLAASMQFTYRNPQRSTTPRRILESARTLIVGAWPYAAHQRPDPAPRPEAEVAAYAWRDHYGSLKAALDTVAQPIRAAGYTTRIVADDNALVDRAAAVRAGIGWSGKSSNVLLPGQGSWFVLGSIVTDAAYEPDQPIADGCGPCRRCIDGCPTGAIVADGVVDARRCLAWLVQAEGDFPVEYRAALGTRIYGCDDCQLVCPPSRRDPVEPVGDEVSALDLLELLTCDDGDLEAAVGRWYIPRRDLRYVRRNALVALGNTPNGTAEAEITEVLDSYANGEDEMLGEHARWARDHRWARGPEVG